MIITSDNDDYNLCARLMDEGNYKEALQRAEAIQNSIYRASIFIDAGSALGKSGKVREGIELFEQLVNSDEIDSSAQCSILYNIANGHNELFILRKQRRKSIIPPNDKDLRMAKRFYREAIKKLPNQRGTFASALYVNYGNCLSELGRFAEAVESYHKGLLADPTNGMAAGNLGIELIYCTDITGRFTHEYLALAYEMLNRALSDTMHLELGSYQGKISFSVQLAKLSQILKAHDYPISVPTPQKPVGKSKVIKAYIKFCIEEGPFLNAWVGAPSLTPGITDDISFGPIMTPINDKFLVPELLHVLNEIKEEFATSRYLFFVSQGKNRLLNEISSLTLYFDTLEPEINGLYIGLLKSAYVRAFDILDKVARIVNIYFKFGSRRDSIWSLFVERQSHGEEHEEWYAMRSDIAKEDNFGLFSLADICIDYFEQEHVDLSTIDSRRNRITHDYLRIRINSEKEDPIEAVDIKNFIEQTRQVLYLAKHAILYVVNAINFAESRKTSDMKVGHFIYKSHPGNPYN